MQVECQVLLKKELSQRNKEWSATCFWRCPCWKKLLNNMKMLVQLCLLHNFLHNHMRYIYRQIYNLKGKKFCLNKIHFLQTVVQSSVSSQQMHRLHWVWVRKTLPSRSCQISFIPCRALCLEHRSSVEVTTELVPCSSALWLFSFIFIIFVFLPIRQGCTRPDLSVAVKPFFYHLRDQRVISPPRALLHGHENSSLSHTAVQPLPEQLFLLFLIT